jgi:hypothetical protein
LNSIVSFFVVFLGFGTEDQTQGLIFTKQALCHRVTPPAQSRTSEPWCAQILILASPELVWYWGSFLKIALWFFPLLSASELVRGLNELITCKAVRKVLISY